MVILKTLFYVQDYLILSQCRTFLSLYILPTQLIRSRLRNKRFWFILSQKMRDYSAYVVGGRFLSQYFCFFKSYKSTLCQIGHLTALCLFLNQNWELEFECWGVWQVWVFQEDWKLYRPCTSETRWLSQTHGNAEWPPMPPICWPGILYYL